MAKRFGALGRLLDWAQTTLPVRFAQRYARDNLPNWAAAVAFHAFYSLFPILLSLWTFVGVVLQDQARLALVAGALQQMLPGGVSEQFVAVLQSTRANTGIFGILSTVGLLYSASALFGSLETAFNGLYGVPGRGFVAQKLMATGMLLLFALLLLSSLVVTSVAEGTRLLLTEVATWLAWLPWEGALIDLGQWLGTLGWILPVGWAFLFFLAIYAVVPNRRLALRQVWPGAAIAALLFLAITQIFPLYLHYFGGFDRYGAVFALALLLLTWFYFLAHTIFIGAAVNAYFLAGPAPPHRAGSRPWRLLRWR